MSGTLTQLRDLTYAVQDGRPLDLDLYLPPVSGPRPLVVWVHGGGWYAGSKDHCLAVSLTDRGYAVASINYRLSHEALFPAQIHDCKGAVRWLRAHAAEYGLDSGRVGAWGDSAGGHLVALLGTSGDVAELEGAVGGNLDQSSRVQAVCDWYGPTDMLQIGGSPSEIDHDAPDSAEARLFGGPIHEKRDLVRLANPITFLRPDAPPFLIVHGDRDPIVPLHQSEILADALRAAGVPVTFLTVAGAGHGFDDPLYWRKAAEFFDETLA